MDAQPLELARVDVIPVSERGGALGLESGKYLTQVRFSARDRIGERRIDSRHMFAQRFRQVGQRSKAVVESKFVTVKLQKRVVSNAPKVRLYRRRRHPELV